MELLHEISEEEFKKYPDTEKLVSNFENTLNIFKDAKEKYLFSFVNDPLAFLLIRKLRLNPWRSALLGFTLVFITYLIGFLLHFILSTEMSGITKTGIDWLFDFILIPVVFGYYVWISPKAGYLFLELKNRGIRLSDEGDYNTFASSSINNLVNNKFWIWASLAITICLLLLTIASVLTGSTLWGPKEGSHILFIFWKVPVVWGLSWYMVLLIFAKETTTVFSIRRLLKKKHLIPNLTHKDKQAGLNPIYEYARTFSYFIMAAGFGFALLYIRGFRYEYISKDFLISLGFLIYIGLSCFFFFLPLGPAHGLLKNLKNETEGKIILLSPLRPAIVMKFTLVSLLPIITLLLSPLLRTG